MIAGDESAGAEAKSARGESAAKSLAGPTTLAAMLVASVATQSASIATMSTTGFLKRVSTSTGSQSVLP